MKLFSRQVVVPKSYEVVYQIIKSSAYYLPKGTFSEEAFSMCCAKRYKGGIISLIPVRGTILQHDHLTKVTLSIYADFGFYLGCFLSLLGVVGLFLCLISHSSRWVPGVGIIILGLFIGGQSIWEERELLNRLELKILS